MNKYVIYNRVSSQTQATDGLSLDVQLEKCRSFVAGVKGEVIGEFSEAASGWKTGRNTGRNRPQLKAAADLARKEDATLLFAKLSRLGRDLEFALRLKNEEVNGKKLKMEFVDFIGINDIVFALMLTIYEQESKTKSEYAKESWAYIKKEIEEKGHYYSKKDARKFESFADLNPSWEVNRELGPIAAANLRIAEKCADKEWQSAYERAKYYRKQGIKVDDIVSTLNETGSRTRRGNPWTKDSVYKLLNAKLI